MAPASKPNMPAVLGGRLQQESQARILFVDDDRTVRTAFARSMRSRGFIVDVAASAVDAIRLAQRQLYAVIITDLRMPGMDGVALIERLKPDLPSTAFVVVTGMPEVDVRRTNLDEGLLNALVIKPWDDDELARTVTRATQFHDKQFLRRMEATSTVVRRSVLLVEDDPFDAEIVAMHLEGAEVDITHVERLGDAVEVLRDRTFDGLVVDLSLPDARGLSPVMRLQEAAPEVPIVVLTAHADDKTALEAMRFGAQDYLVKGKVDGTSLQRSMRYAEERKRAERRLAQLAHFDQLTGLANRLTLRDRMQQLLARARRLDSRWAVMFLDLDRFKAINDEHGHAAGDVLLQEVARRIQASVREYDTVARLGGDEFAILLDLFEDDEAPRTVAARVLANMANPIDIGERHVNVTTSIGVAMYPDSALTAAELLKHADAAMYEAKRRGRNQVFVHVTEHPEEAAFPRFDLVLRGALERGDFKLHFQPMHAAADGHVACFEALLRLEHAGELVSPAKFIPQLERTGQIKEVGAWVIREACRSLAQWRRDGGDMRTRVAVNLSARQFEDDLLVTSVRKALEENRLDAEALELEITESTLMLDTTRTNELLDAFAEIGVRLAIDDFGTGYSSLAYLRRFAVDTLKVDRSFVNNLTQHEDDRAIVSAVIGLGHRLGLEVVAEGVETEEQLAILRDEDCDILQGFLLGRPAPKMQGASPQDFATWRESAPASGSSARLDATSRAAERAS